MKALRTLIFTIAAFISLTSIGGGVAMLVGIDKFPIEWLQGTPFDDYTIPALLLTIVVGGSSLIAAIASVFLKRLSAYTAIMAGVFMAGFITVEVALLNQEPKGPTVLEVLYFGLGSLLFSLGILLMRKEKINQARSSSSGSSLRSFSSHTTEL